MACAIKQCKRWTPWRRVSVCMFSLASQSPCVIWRWDQMATHGAEQIKYQSEAKRSLRGMSIGKHYLPQSPASHRLYLYLCRRLAGSFRRWTTAAKQSKAAGGCCGLHACRQAGRHAGRLLLLLLHDTGTIGWALDDKGAEASGKARRKSKGTDSLFNVSKSTQ